MLLRTLGLAGLALPLTVLANGKAGEQTVGKRVAIIGAGAAGSSAAYHLAQNAAQASIPSKIDVYERAAHIGGRSTTINAWNDTRYSVELGASIFVAVNHILANASRDFGLRTADHDIYDSAGMPDLGVWNGKEFVFTMTNEGGWWDMTKLFWRYRYAPVKTNALMKETVGKFLNMYEEPVFPFLSLSQAVRDVGLVEVTGLTGEQYLEQKGAGGLFAEEIVQASTRVNYASNLDNIHGVETMVCMAANGAMQIEGGNWKIFDHMLSSSSTISTHLNNTISHITKQANGTYTLRLSSSNSTHTYDEVILASPLQFSNLSINPAPRHVPDAIPYVNLHVTHFATPLKLDPKAFGLKEGAAVPETVLTTVAKGESGRGRNETDNGSTGFFSISIVKSGVNPRSAVPRPEYIFKIFSDRRVDAAFLTKYLGVEVTDYEVEYGNPDGNVSWIHHKLFHSYPHEFPRVTFDEIALDDHLWYTSGMESFISTMETSALMGKNVAKLIVNEWLEKKENEEDEGLKVQGGPDWKYEALDKQKVLGQQPQKPMRAKL
ncbi:prenylcysteine oxidase-like protein 1 precursor [Massarina eburnea CBS 473.64]|uniref:Prenylcysteine oxidase-like protein 1 n=1 Tax=Massarina eburnea CBS 473.64 TaxID=1395130 RepID=A0A6A6S171_9PLEO|nr:prenylcysteine oxidase-like protein 1 precursor [Massarina eburnea CBS 473.64]